MSEKVVVTGGAGFIGHVFIKHLIENTKFEIISIDRLDYSGNLNRISDMMQNYDADTQSRVKIIHHDLKAEINNLVQSQIGDVKHIFHIAASSHVDRAIEDPMTFVQDNVVATCNLLNYARQIDDLETFVYFSTDEVFGPALGGVKFKEWDRYNSTNPYSASKAGGEELAIAFHNTYDVPVIITHCMNVFGERQHPEKFIPNTVLKALNNEKIIIHADSTKSSPGSRHYVHVDDVADAVLFIINNKEKLKEIPDDQYGAKCKKINIASSFEMNNLEVAESISKYLGLVIDYELVDFHSTRPGHDLRYALDDSLIASMGWKPSKSTQEGLEQVTKWYSENQEWLKF